MSVKRRRRRDGNLESGLVNSHNYGESIGTTFESQFRLQHRIIIIPSKRDLPISLMNEACCHLATTRNKKNDTQITTGTDQTSYGQHSLGDTPFSEPTELHCAGCPASGMCFNGRAVSGV